MTSPAFTPHTGEITEQMQQTQLTGRAAETAASDGTYFHSRSQEERSSSVTPAPISPAVVTAT